VYTEPSAGYASVDLRSQVAEPFRVGQTVKVFLSDSSDTDVQLFGGVLSDVEAQAVSVQGGVLVGYRLTAVGPLARLNRRTVLFDGRPSEDDGARVLAALLAGLAGAWEEQPDTLAWEDAEGTFDTFDGIDTTLVDDGVFTLSALGTAEAGYNPLRVAQEAAFSGLGMLYETRTGTIGYADAARRADNADAGYAPVPAASLSIDGVQVASSLSDITNRVTVEFDGGVVTVTDDDSLQEFGLFQTEFATQLVNQSNAELWADRYVEKPFAAGVPCRSVPADVAGVGDGTHGQSAGGGAERCVGVHRAADSARAGCVVRGVRGGCGVDARSVPHGCGPVRFGCAVVVG
jgi:hypothetical protein